MKVLLDECLPRKLKQSITGHDVRTVPEMGWSGTKNGALLRLAEQNFDVFVTADQNVEYQQNLGTAQIAIIVLVAPNNRLRALRPLMTRMMIVLPTVRAGNVVRVAASDL